MFFIWFLDTSKLALKSSCNFMGGGSSEIDSCHVKRVQVDVIANCRPGNIYLKLGIHFTSWNNLFYLGGSTRGTTRKTRLHPLFFEMSLLWPDPTYAMSLWILWQTSIATLQLCPEFFSREALRTRRRSLSRNSSAVLAATNWPGDSNMD